MKKQSTPETILLPAPVTLPNLRSHFKEMYGLNLTQTEVMLESSSLSLVQVFESAKEVLSNTNPREQLGPVMHGLKGLLLNMGENEWAAVARDVEQKLKKEVQCDFNRIVAGMKAGLADILFYERDKKGRSADFDIMSESLKHQPEGYGG